MQTAPFRSAGRLLALLIVLPFAVACQTIDAPYMRAHYTKREVMIPMRDGVRLFTSIYVPKDASRKHPILLRRTPYSCAPYGADAYSAEPGVSNKYFAQRNYILVTQDVRGRFMSEGEFEDVRPYRPIKRDSTEIDETTDTYDTVDWLVKHVEGNNGNVGISGISYPGFYTWMGTIDAHPAVKATSPQAPVSEWMGGDDWFHNGAFLLPHAFDFLSNFGWPRPQPLERYPGHFQHTTPDGYQFYLSMGAIPNFNATYLHDSVALWNDITRHGTWDSFWEQRSVLRHLTNIRPAVLVVGGWYDTENLFGALHSYGTANAENANNRISLVMGPWPHGWWEIAGLDSLGDIKFGSVTTQYFIDSLEGPFFEHYLNGGPDPNLPEASVFLTGTDEWRGLAAWPPPNAVPERLSLQAHGRLSFEPSSGNDSPFDEYTSDPAAPVPYTAHITNWYDGAFMNEDQRFASRRPDVLTYETDVLNHDVTIAGPIGVNLSASTSGTDCDWIVKVIDVFPDTLSWKPGPRGTPLAGYQMLVRGDVLRGKFRNGTAHPEPVEPGAVTSFRFGLQDVFHTFRTGHRITVQVQSTWFPMIDRNPGVFEDIFHAKDLDFRKTTQRVYHTAEHPSTVTVNVLR